MDSKKPAFRTGKPAFWWRRVDSNHRFTVCPLWPLGNSSIFFGAGGRIRTPDLLITNQLLYRLSYTSAWRLSNSERYYNKGMEVCQVKNRKFFLSPLRDIQNEPPAWICPKCGDEQYQYDRCRRGSPLCAQCLDRLEAEEETP